MTMQQERGEVIANLPAWADNGYRLCPECRRGFDLRNETDAAKWYYGHDCEAS